MKIMYTVDDLKEILCVGDTKAYAIIRDLNLRHTRYLPLAAYGHMGREELGVAWEKTDRTDALRAAAAAQ